jgi:hypothetical protein
MAVLLNICRDAAGVAVSRAGADIRRAFQACKTMLRACFACCPSERGSVAGLQ